MLFSYVIRHSWEVFQEVRDVVQLCDTTSCPNESSQLGKQVQRWNPKLVPSQIRMCARCGFELVKASRCSDPNGIIKR